MTGPVTTEAPVDGDHDMPSEAEIEAMREEAENFRLPAPPPIPVRDPYYLTECEHCGWVGSSEHCGNGGAPDYDDVVCTVCCSSMLGDAPNEADTAKHGEAVYQRIVTAEAERDAALAALQRVTAERDEAISACAEMIRLAEMGFDEAMAEPEENGSYAAFQRAKAACEAAPGVAEAVKTLAGQYATAISELARLRERLEIAHAYDGAGNKIPFPEGMEHLDGIECRDETIRNLEEQIDRLRAEGEAKDRALKALEEASRPFAACVFNDNGDVTLSTGRLNVHDWLRLDRAQRTVLARAATAREG